MKRAEIETTHEHCATCDWLGREAERTAHEAGTGHWTSETQTGDTTQVAHYQAEVGLTEKNTEKEN